MDKWLGNMINGKENMWVKLKQVLLMDLDYLFSKMEIRQRDNGKMGKDMENR